MFRAISLGVFWRSAPSTSAIMRSRNVWPGSDVIRTLIWSESTRVPPVTALRSPPLSRMTGADSPVMADSSTEAMPSMTSPSPGIVSPAETTTTSPLRSSLACFWVMTPSTSTLARVSVLVLRRVSAWALPRPSAIAVAKLANSTVNQSQPLTRPTNRALWPLPARAAMKAMVVMTLPISTTNITGLRATSRGSSLTSELRTAGPMRSFMEAFRGARRGGRLPARRFAVRYGGLGGRCG